MNIIRPVDYDTAVKITDNGGIVYAIVLFGWFDTFEGCCDAFQYVELTSKNLASMKKEIEELNEKSWFVLASDFCDITGDGIDIDEGTAIFTWRCPKKLRNVSDMLKILSSAKEKNIQ